MAKNETSFVKNLLILLIILAQFVFIDAVSFAEPIVIDHTCTNLSQIPRE